MISARSLPCAFSLEDGSAEGLLKGCELPSGATTGDDGTINLPLQKPVCIPLQRPTDGAADQPVSQLVFRRLTGADLMQNSSGASVRIRMIIARALRISAASYSELAKILSATDAVAIHRVVAALVQDEPGLPSQADARPDGSVFLPLAYPVSDGVSQAHKAFTIRPLSRRDQAAIPSGLDRFLPFALHYSTGIPLKPMRRIAELMDATDFCAADRVIRWLLAQPVPLFEGRAYRPGRQPKSPHAGSDADAALEHAG